MCNKTLVKLILKANSNSCSKSFSYPNRSNYNQISFGLSNLKQFSITTKKLCNPTKINTICNDFPKSSSVDFSNCGLGIVGCRSYCSKKEHGLPKIMDFPQVIWPSVFKSIRNWILSNFIIMRYFDSEFNLPDFVTGSRQAVEIVSGAISRGDMESLGRLVTPEVLVQVRESLNTFTLKQRQEFEIRADDIFFCFPYEVGIMFPNDDKNEGENQSRFVEITMCFHAFLGLQDMKEAGVALPNDMGTLPEYEDKLFICNYRFIREFTKGVQDDWTINAINHFKPARSH